MTTQQERARANERRFADANEEIRTQADRLDTEDGGHLVPFLCECSSLECFRIIQLLLADYEHAKAGAPDKLFILVPDHENGSLERIVRDEEGFVVVAKFDADRSP